MTNTPHPPAAWLARVTPPALPGWRWLGNSGAATAKSAIRDYRNVLQQMGEKTAALEFRAEPWTPFEHSGTTFAVYVKES